MLKQNPHDHILYRSRLDELESLAEAIGYDVRGKIVQTRKRPDPKYYIGKGKLEEIRSEAEENDISSVIWWNILPSRQKYDIELALRTDVRDRSDLILDIFSQNAHTTEAELQIRLAKLKKRFPYERYKAWLRLQKERPGPRALGEYAYHGKVNQLQKTIKNTEQKLEKIMRRKSIAIEERKQIGKLVTITGFYNSGKTTLFNLLTDESKPIGDVPFTTLASKVSGTKECFIADSIGFVQDMSDLEEIIASFKLTLEDIKAADLVLCMIDGSEDLTTIWRKLDEASKILSDLNVSPDKTLLILNKVDLLNEKEIEERLDFVKRHCHYHRDLLLTSALTGEGVNEIVEILNEPN